MSDEQEAVTLPCGCFLNPVVVDGRKELRISPCKMDCINLKNALEMASEAQLPIEKRRV